MRMNNQLVLFFLSKSTPANPKISAGRATSKFGITQISCVITANSFIKIKMPEKITTILVPEIVYDLENIGALLLFSTIIF